jgi:hypothetical protein
MKTAKIIAWIYLASIVFMILMKGIPSVFNNIGGIGSLLITLAIVIVAQKK